MFFFFSCFESSARIDLVYSKQTPFSFAFTMAKFSPNGKKIAAGLQGSDWDSTRFSRVIIYNASDGDSLMELKGHHGNFITSLTWINDSILASGDNNNELYQKRTVIIWNVNTGENLHTFFDNDSLYPWHSFVKNLVYLNGKNKLYVELFTDKKLAINHAPPWEYVYWHDTVLVLNTSTFELIKPLSFSDTNDYHDIAIICGAPDGSYYYMEDEHAQLRNPDNDSIIWQSDSSFNFGFSQISPNGRYGISAISNSVRIYNIENRSFLNLLKFDSINNIKNALISPDSRFISVTGYYEKGSYRRWDKFGIAEIANLSNQTLQDSIICELSFDSSSDSLFILCLDESMIRIYSAPWSPKNTKVDDKNEEKDFLIISPNPAEEYIEISVGSRHALTNTDIRIYNVFGEMVSTSVCSADTSASGGQRIDVSGLPSGVYFVRVGDKVGKFVKI